MADEKIKRGGKLTNAASIKKFCLQWIKDTRPEWKVNRISQSVLDQAEAHMRLFLTNKIHPLPSRGKTLDFS